VSIEAGLGDNHADFAHISCQLSAVS
jgi:hypothetical protein